MFRPKLSSDWEIEVQPDVFMDDDVNIAHDRTTLDIVGCARASTYALLNPNPYSSICGRDDYLLDRLDSSGLNLYAGDNLSNLSGVRLNLLSDVKKDDYCGMLLDVDLGKIERKDVVLASRLFVSPNVTAVRSIRRLFSSCYRFSLNAGKSTAIVLSRHEHVNFYLKYGYQRDGKKIGDLDVLKLAIHDFETLEQIRSPFVKVANEHRPL